MCLCDWLVIVCYLLFIGFVAALLVLSLLFVMYLDLKEENKTLQSLFEVLK